MSDTPSGSHDKLAQRAHALFQTGNEAALKNNLDYASNMFREALKLEPGNLLYRQALRGVQRRRFQNDPSKVSMLVGARNQPIRLRASSARNKSKWVEAIEHCEDAFAHNPWDVQAAIIASEAAEGLEELVLARWLLESVAAQGSDDVNYLRHLARIYERNEDWERSISCWERLRKISPTDDEAIRKIRGLQASATISRSGLGDAIHRVERQEDEKPDLDPDLEKLKSHAQTPEERLRGLIAEEPTRVAAYLELADLLKRSNRLDESEKMLARAVKQNPGDELLIQAHAEVQIARLQRAISVQRRKVRDQPDDEDLKARLDQLTTVLDDYEVKEFQRRAECRPEDLSNRYHLGVRLARKGRHDEAIAEFQKARHDPTLQLKALYELGLCFEAKDLPKLAERNYQEALKLVDAADQEMTIVLHYRLGRAAESQGDLKAAEEHYNEVAATDYGYEDVAQRLESLNRRRGP